MKIDFTRVMKTLLSACAFITILSCTEKEVPSGPPDGGSVSLPVRFETVDAGSPSGPLAPGTEAAVLIDGRVHRFTADSQGSLTSSGDLSWKEGGERLVKAWIPYSPECPEAFDGRQEDFLYAVRRLVPTGKDQLVFKHQFAKVVVIFETGLPVSEVTVGNPSFRLNGAWTAGDEAGRWGAPEVQKTGEQELKESGDRTFIGYVVPQVIAADRFVHATVGGQRLYFSPAEAMELVAGHVHTFKLAPSDGTDPDPVTPTLNADKAEILADGVEKVTFTVTPAELATIVGDGHAYQGRDGSVFATLVPGTYRFRAVNGTKESGVLSITAFAAPELTASPASIQVGESVHLKVMFKGMDQTASASFKVDGVPFTGPVFIPETAGEHTLTAEVGGYSSNTVTVTATPVPVQPLVLSADRYTVSVNGGAATLTVRQGDRDITSEVRFETDKGQVIGNRFSSLEAGTANVTAHFQDRISNTIRIEVIDDTPVPTLSGNKDNLVADGRDEVRFTVHPEAASIVHSLNGGPEMLLEGRSFKTTVPGTYTFIARCNGKDSLPFVLHVLPPADPERPMEGEVTVTSPGEGGAWDNIGTDDGTVDL